MSYTFGQRSYDIVTDNRGNVLANVTLDLTDWYSGQELAQVTTKSDGRWLWVDQTNTHPSIRATLPNGVWYRSDASEVTGTQGPPGDKGPKGDPGPVTNWTVDSVTTGEAGTQAAVTVSGTAPDLALSFTIPQGDPGPVAGATIDGNDVVMQQRRDTAASWTDGNPVLPEGVLGIEEGTNKMKAGDGTTAWNSLPYISGGGTGDTGSLATVATTGKAADLVDVTAVGEAVVTADSAATARAALDVPANADLASYVQDADLAAVATSGKYSDLISPPLLAAVATTGSFDSLEDKPPADNYVLFDTAAGAYEPRDPTLRRAIFDDVSNVAAGNPSTAPTVGGADGAVDDDYWDTLEEA